MEEDYGRLVFENRDTTGALLRDFDPKLKFIKDVKIELGKIQGLDLERSSEANQVSTLPGAEHLNPKLIAAVIYFRYNTKGKKLKDMSRKAISNQIKTALTEIYGSMDSQSMGYRLLKGDMIRYITLVENE